MYVEIELPFTGFDHTEHDQILTDALEDMFQDDSGTKHIPDDFDCMTEVDWIPMYKAYGREYVTWFNEWLSGETWQQGIIPVSKGEDVEFTKSMWTTDRLFAQVPMRTVVKWAFEVDIELLQRRIKERFTSYDGFWSDYSNKLSDWLDCPLDEWDHNELATLLQAWLLTQGIAEDSVDAYVISEDARCNSGIDSIVWNHITASGRAIIDRVTDELIAAGLR